MMIHRMHKKELKEGTFHVPGRYIFDPKNKEAISSGSHGIVVIAHDRFTHKDVAIKKMKDPFAHKHSAKRAHREFIFSQIVNHKNVMRLYNAFTPQNTLSTFSDVYLITEYFTFPLSYLIQKQHQKIFMSQNGAELISYLFYQLLCGIRHLHKAGIIHRDLSVNNIVVNKKSELKIIDLGLARPDPELGGDNLTGYVTTRPYRAPEIVLGSDSEKMECDTIYDRKVDVWSAGCILGEMILGKPLFPGNNNFDQWQKIISTVGSPGKEFASTLNEGLKNFVELSPKFPAKKWSEIFPDDAFPKVSPNRQMYQNPKLEPKHARDLLSKILVIDPRFRFSVDQALDHPYVLWQHEPGEMETETNPNQYYNGDIEKMNLSENEWKTLIFGELKQYELMNNLNSTNMPIHECEKCIQWRCECSECTKMDLEKLLKNAK